MTTPKKFRKECPECGSLNVVYNPKKDETICKACGAIFEPLIPEKEKKFERVRAK